MKKTTDLEYHLKRPTITIADLRRLFDALKEAGITSQKLSVEFIDDPKTTVTFENVSEIEPTTRRIKSLRMFLPMGTKGYPFLSLVLASHGRYVKVDISSVEDRAIFESTKDALKPAENRLRWLFSKLEYLYFLAFPVALVLLQYAGTEYKKNEASQPADRAVIAALLILVVIGVRAISYFLFHYGQGFTVLLVESEKDSTFWSRNKEKILVNFVVGVTLLLIGYFLGVRN